MPKTKQIFDLQIENDRGMFIPQSMLKEANLSGDVVLEVQESGIVIRTKRSVRAGWAEQLRRMAERGDDRLLFDEPEEWEW